MGSGAGRPLNSLCFPEPVKCEALLGDVALPLWQTSTWRGRVTCTLFIGTGLCLLAEYTPHWDAMMWWLPW